MRVESATPEIAEAAARGPHGHWDTFDSSLEGARFHLLHATAATEPFDAVEAERLSKELEELAHSYGYGLADSFICDAGDMTDEEIDSNPHLAYARRNLETEPEEDPYFIEAAKSSRLLREAAATPEAKAFFEDTTDPETGRGTAPDSRMLAAFERGRDVRKAQENSPPAP